MLVIIIITQESGLLASDGLEAGDDDRVDNILHGATAAEVVHGLGLWACPRRASRMISTPPRASPCITGPTAMDLEACCTAV